MKLASYYVPGLYIEDHSIDVPLDWRGLEPALLALGSTMRRGAMPSPIPGAPREHQAVLPHRLLSRAFGR